MSELNGIKTNAEVIKELYYSRKHLLVLRVVSWDGKAPVIEKRKLYIDKETHEIKHGRVMGLSRNDLDYIKDNYADLSTLMDEWTQKHNDGMRSGKWPIREVGKIENA